MPSTKPPLNLPSLVQGKAKIDVDFKVLLRQDSTFRKDLIYRAIVAAVGLVLLNPVIVLAGLGLLAPLALRYRSIVSLMRNGQVMPARLVSIDPPLVATLADLSRGLGSFHPILTIFEVPMSALVKPLAGTIERGDRVPVVSQGVGGDASKYDAVTVRLISTVNEDPMVQYKALNSIPEWDWESLDEVLFDFGSHIEPGTHVLSFDPFA